MRIATIFPTGSAYVADSKPAGSLPASSVVKLSRKFFEDVWWVARIEGKAPSDLLKELCGDRLASRRKKVEPDIEVLKRKDAETAQVVSKARDKLRAGQE